MSSEKINSKRAIGLAIGAVFFLLLLVYGYGYWKWKIIEQTDSITQGRCGDISPRFEGIVSLFESIDHQIPESLSEAVFCPILSYGYHFSSIIAVRRGDLYPADYYRSLGGPLFSSVESVSIHSNWKEPSLLSEIKSFRGCTELQVAGCLTFGSNEISEIERKFPNLEKLEIATRELDWQSILKAELETVTGLSLGVVRTSLGEPAITPAPQDDLALGLLPSLFPNLEQLVIQLEEGTTIEKLSNLPKLNHLWANTSNATPNFGKSISTIPSLDRVGVEGPSRNNPTPVDGVFQGPIASGVLELTFVYGKVDTTASAALLRKFPKIREISFKNCVVPAEFLRGLPASTNLQNVRFSGVLVEGETCFPVPPVYLANPNFSGTAIHQKYIGERDVKFSELDDLPGLLERFDNETRK